MFLDWFLNSRSSINAETNKENIVVMEMVDKYKNNSRLILIQKYATEENLILTIRYCRKATVTIICSITFHLCCPPVAIRQMQVIRYNAQLQFVLLRVVVNYSVPCSILLIYLMIHSEISPLLLLALNG